MGPGGGYDITARLLARHFGRHVLGNPNVIVNNMPGGAGTSAASYIANATPQNGLALGTFIDGLTLTKLIRPEFKFNPEKLVWIGRVAPLVGVGAVWHTAKAKSVEELKTQPITMAATAKTQISSLKILALNDVVGTQIRPIYGYAGANEYAMAMEKGEVDAVAGIGWETVTTRYGHWLSEKKVNILYGMGSTRFKAYPSAPAMPEFAKNENDRKMLHVLVAGADVGRAFAAEPGIPAERAAALKSAFNAVMKDPAFVAEADRLQVDLDPISGDEVQKIVAEMVATPAPLIDRIRKLLE
jgi:tripartite-type tricarboxylate transporter receptor subunit TctC